MYLLANIKLGMLYTPKSETASKRFIKPLFSDAMFSNITDVFLVILGIAAVIVLSLIIFVVYNNRRRDL